MNEAGPHIKRCSHVTSCELFPRFSLQSSLKVWQMHYCEGDYERCARFRLALAGKRPAPNLLPNGKELALATPGTSR